MKIARARFSLKGVMVDFSIPVQSDDPNLPYYLDSSINPSTPGYKPGDTGGFGIPTFLDPLQQVHDIGGVVTTAFGNSINPILDKGVGGLPSSLENATAQAYYAPANALADVFLNDIGQGKAASKIPLLDQSYTIETGTPTQGTYDQYGVGLLEAAGAVVGGDALYGTQLGDSALASGLTTLQNKVKGLAGALVESFLPSTQKTGTSKPKNSSGSINNMNPPSQTVIQNEALIPGIIIISVIAIVLWRRV